MIEPKVLDHYGCTTEALRSVFECSWGAGTDELSEEKKEALQKKIDTRKRWEDRINNRLMAEINDCLKTCQLIGAVDLAFDAPPITKETYPLVLYAQGRLSTKECATQLASLGCADRYTKKDEKGRVSGIDLPQFCDININLIRHYTTRRLAAQTNKYNSLYPFFKYEPRGTSQVAKLRSDLLSQRMDMMSDDFDYRGHDTQVFRDTLLYGHSVDFVRSSWEKEIQIRCRPPVEGAPEEKIDLESYTAKEGVGWINPHFTRVFYDKAFPISSINSDTGCSYVGYWDVTRYGTIRTNPDYWNRDQVTFSSGFVSLFSTYQSYFSQYYTQICVPSLDRAARVNAGGADNDLKNNLGRYAATDNDTAMLVAVYFEKLVPKDEGLGNYPYPVWVRFVVAGDGTIINAEYLPSRPGAYCGINENDSRQLNLSFAMELMPYQDQMSNLMTQLLAVCKQEQMKIIAVDKDVLEGEALKRIERQANSGDWFARPILLEYSGMKMAGLGANVREPVHISQPQTNPQSIQIIFNAMVTLLQTVERLTAMSPNESGQPIARGNGGVTATEASNIEQTTNSVFNFISDGFDAFRAAKKQILYESYMAHGEANFVLPVTSRYSASIVQRAGLTIVDEDGPEVQYDPMMPRRYLLTGLKRALAYTYIFTSRDGAERSMNIQAATALIQLMPLLQDPEVRQAMGKDKFLELVGEIFRLASAFDPQFEGGGDQFGNPDELKPEAVKGLMEMMTGSIEQLNQRLGQLEQQIQDVASAKVQNVQAEENRKLLAFQGDEWRKNTSVQADIERKNVTAASDIARQARLDRAAP
jgi:hypothetical protein